jgi:hypothetical protein
MDLQIFKSNSFLDFILKLLKSDYPEQKTGTTSFLSLAKFDNQHMLI